MSNQAELDDYVKPAEIEAISEAYNITDELGGELVGVKSSTFSAMRCQTSLPRKWMHRSRFIPWVKALEVRHRRIFKGAPVDHERYWYSDGMYLRRSTGFEPPGRYVT